MLFNLKILKIVILITLITTTIISTIISTIIMIMIDDDNSENNNHIYPLVKMDLMIDMQNMTMRVQHSVFPVVQQVYLGILVHWF